ncbi:MAG: TPM domain-containing protein [Clostridia bacterium]|nr:TPM domain-containing protein [Clostridia bacterium]
MKNKGSFNNKRLTAFAVMIALLSALVLASAPVYADLIYDPFWEELDQTIATEDHTVTERPETAATAEVSTVTEYPETTATAEVSTVTEHPETTTAAEVSTVTEYPETTAAAESTVREYPKETARAEAYVGNGYTQGPAQTEAYAAAEYSEEWTQVEDTESPVYQDYTDNKTYIVDEADLLNYDEEAELQSLLSSKSNELDFDIVIVTTNDMGGKDEVAYADDYFDYNGYGRGVNKDGCLLLIHMDENRGAYISTTGRGITDITDYGIDHLLDETVPHLSNGDYYQAFNTFAYSVERLVTSGDSGDIYDVSESTTVRSTKRFNTSNLFLGAIAGLIVSLIVNSKLKKQLISVHMKANASDYFDQGSLNMKRSYDRFVGRTVTRTAKPKDDSRSGGGGSSTHTSSSGTSHGGGGRSF